MKAVRSFVIFAWPALVLSSALLLRGSSFAQSPNTDAPGERGPASLLSNSISPAPKDPLTPLTDVDLDFLLSKPRIPWNSDPFEKRPGFMEVTESEEKLTLTAIAWSDIDPMAIINGHAAYPGDIVKGYRVTRIGTNYVILKKGKDTIELTLPPINNVEQSADELIDDHNEPGGDS